METNVESLILHIVGNLSSWQHWCRATLVFRRVSEVPVFVLAGHPHICQNQLFSGESV